MNSKHRELISLFLSIAIVSVSLFIIHKFILPLAWASIIAIATFPVYSQWRKLCRDRSIIAALSLTFFIAIIIIIPISWLTSLLVKEMHSFIQYLVHLNRSGQVAPQWLTQLPWIGKPAHEYWQQYLGQPGGLNRNILAKLHLSITPARQMVQQIGLDVVHRGIILFFTILCLFFMYRDGSHLSMQINRIGVHQLGSRWKRFARQLPAAIRATVNGTIFVALGVGILMGLAYRITGVQAPVLLGLITAVLAVVPFGAPVIFVSVAILLGIKGKILAGILLLIWGTIVMFVADHAVKPMLIGNATRLHFLAVLFGILGGIETVGLIGLFLGPIVMVLFMTLWNEQSAVSGR